MAPLIRNLARNGICGKLNFVEKIVQDRFQKEIVRRTICSSAASNSVQVSSTDSIDAQLSALKQIEDMLKKAKIDARKHVDEEETSSGPKFSIGTFNAISREGLNKFPKSRYEVVPLADHKDAEPHAILLRSHKLKDEEVPASVRAIARCGAGTNNIPVDRMTQRGIPVFNTPGANANAVKELIICALLLASRGIVEGIQHTKVIFEEDGNDIAKVKKRVEADKKKFVGRELAGATLGVIGLGHIGASVAQTGINLGMNVIGYDPALSVDSAWKLPGQSMRKTETMEALLEEADYISLNVPYMKATHHLIGEEEFKIMKPSANMVNFARGEIVDGEAMRRAYDTGARSGRYICDFPDENLHDHPLVTIIPHLGASTHEAEANSAQMAADQIMKFIETGAIINSVNFPKTVLEVPNEGARLCIVNRNVPGVLGLISSTIGSAGLNITQQVNSSRDEIAYTVLDLAEQPDGDTIERVQNEIAKLDGVISSRYISPTVKPGFFRVYSETY